MPSLSCSRRGWRKDRACQGQTGPACGQSDGRASGKPRRCGKEGTGTKCSGAPTRQKESRPEVIRRAPSRARRSLKFCEMQQHLTA
jgi:hypothetical protein